MKHSYYLASFVLHVEENEKKINKKKKKKKKTCWRKWTCHTHTQILKQTWTFHSHWWHTVCLRSRQNSSDHTCWLFIDFCWHTVFKCTPDIWWPHNANMVLIRKIHSEPGKVCLIKSKNVLYYLYITTTSLLPQLVL